MFMTYDWAVYFCFLAGYPGKPVGWKDGAFLFGPKWGGGRQKYWYVQGSTNTPPPLPFLDARRGGRVIPAGGKIGPAGGLLREGGGGVAGWRIRLFGRAWEWFSDLPACLCACLGAQNRDLGRGLVPGPWGGLSACLPGQLVWHVRRTAGGARGRRWRVACRFRGAAAALCWGREGAGKVYDMGGWGSGSWAGQVDFTCFFTAALVLFPVSSCSLGGNHRGRSLFPFPFPRPVRSQCDVSRDRPGLGRRGQCPAALSLRACPSSDTVSLPCCPRRSVM